MADSEYPDANASSSPDLSLRERMRRRRPHLFSDTLRSGERRIDREILDYHLETLTKRKQEYQFEHLARALAEKELCPNLRTQTGPSGGGDSKVDSETYAVSPAIAERWLVGEAAANERWGFAFSTKEDWRAKVKSDVASIVSTDRNYARIYCITSRYAPDKQRAALEDALSSENGIPVTILDRSWLLDKIYANNHLALVVDTLGLSATDSPVEQLGPIDASRIRRLDDLDQQIADPNRYREARYSLAEDCFTSALLARGLERPRSEVEARFGQARRVAEECGVDDQQKRIIYAEAWTALWWYEDHAKLLGNYEALEALTTSSSLADEFEQLSNLWQLLSGSCVLGALDFAQIDLAGKRERLTLPLQALANDSARPNNAAHAKYVLAIVDAHVALAAGEFATLDLIWNSLVPLIAGSEALLSLPLESMIASLEAMSEYVPNSDAYEALLDSFVPVLEARRSNAAAGRALARRGMQKVKAGKFDDAIRLLGRAELRLAKEEHIEVFIQVLMAMASAYLAIGLPWAARTKLLMAVDRSFAVMKGEGDIPPSLLTSLHNLSWVEIRLGRLPQSLAAWRHYRTMATQVEMDEAERSAFDDDMHLLGRLLGHMLLNGSMEQLPRLIWLPDGLHRLDLGTSAMMLLWALGQENVARERYLAPEDRGEDVRGLFLNDLSHPEIRAIPRAILIGDEDALTFSAHALGCELRFILPNESSAIHVAEAVASAFEAFLATSLKQSVTPYRDYFRFELREGETDRYSAVWHSAPEPYAELIYPARTILEGNPDRSGFDEWLREIIGQTIVRTLYMHNPEEWLTEIAGTEEGFSRAISLGNVPILASSVFGSEPLHRLDYWMRDGDRAYPLLRTSPWAEGADAPDIGSEIASSSRDRGAGGSRRPFDFDNHSRLRVTSIIDLPLWESANWIGTGMAVFDDEAPILALCFRNIEAGSRIFEGWRARFGDVDEQESIRVAIIQGFSHSDPTGYAVTVGRNTDTLPRDDPDAVFTMLSRINRMEQASSENLMNFLIAYQQYGSYRLVPMDMTSQVTMEAFKLDVAITKRRLELRRAWQIGPHDPDLSALRDDDDPIIPADVENPPVRDGLAAIREWRVGKQPMGGEPGWMGTQPTS